MSINVSEDTELNIPIKSLIAIIFGLISASWYVFTTQEDIHNLETEVKMLRQDFDSYKTQPSRSATDVELIKRDIEYLKQHKH